MFADKIAEHMECLQQGESDSDPLHVCSSLFAVWLARLPGSQDHQQHLRQGGGPRRVATQRSAHSARNRKFAAAPNERYVRRCGYDRKTFPAHTCLLLYLYEDTAWYAV